jgi:hypothetical protein
MINEAMLVTAIKDSGISRIAIIDDVFDTPAVTENNAGPLLDYLERKEMSKLLPELKLVERDAQLAIEALQRSDYEAEELSHFMTALYKHFVSTLDPKFDPDKMFNVAKGINLNKVKLLIQLLTKCRPKVEFEQIGSKMEDLETIGTQVQLIFIDYYLSSNIPADVEPNPKQGREATAAAVEVVTRLIAAQGENAPSVILMSAHDVRKKADAFREKIVSDGRGRVYASRFRYLSKDDLESSNNGEVGIKAESGDDLLDVVQSFEFGRGLQMVLDRWLTGATGAIEELSKEIKQLELKDFAYLHRFRLVPEGQSLLEYFEWFFGECLLDAVARKVDKSGGDAEAVPAVSGPAVERIEGAFDGPTKKVAELYHRVRIEDPRTSRGSNYRLGDLYIAGTGKSRLIRAVMTPDCDLIIRDNGKRSAPRLLTVSGRVKGFEEPDSSVSDFVMLENRPYNIAWNKKGVGVEEFKNWPNPGDSTDEIKFIGTLRSLYAQELQRNLLHDLGRVGVSVAPAIAVMAAVKVTVKEKGGSKRDIEIAQVGSAPCYVVPRRDVSDKSRVIFRRHFVRQMIQNLQELDCKLLHKSACGLLKQLKDANVESKFRKMYKDGVYFEEVIDLGVFLTGNPGYKSPENGPWCWLTVAMGEL